MKKICFFAFLNIFTTLFSQEKGYSEYYWLRKKYENYEENNAKALPYIQVYIDKAKKEKDYEKLMQGYRDGIFYSKENAQKLKYADSIIGAAKLSGKDDLQSTAYLEKGVVYYYNYRKYTPALEEYLKANQYSKYTKDFNLKNKIFYHLGVVKSYLGYYEDAANLFLKSLTYFEDKSKKNLHPNEIYNHKKGYFNSIHQLIVCYENLNKQQKADSLITVGMKITQNDADYRQEKGYFLKCRGISDYTRKQYPSAITNLKQSLSIISSTDDFAWISVDYFYLGKSYLGLGDYPKAVDNFKKVDSIFIKNKFILPVLRENYEHLIDYYKKEPNTEKQLYYTNQLLKADSVISKDFAYLSPKIHKEYDTKTLLDEKRELEKAFSWSTVIIGFLIATAVILLIVLLLRYKKEKDIRLKYRLLEERMLHQQNNPAKENPLKTIEDKRTGLNKKTTEEILEKLRIFEEKKIYNQKGLTIQKLAHQIDTNTKYLSQIINDYKGGSFNKYLGELRINYITKQLFEDKKYLQYTIDAMAKECSIASRQNFSDLFYEINGIRPADFIKRRKAELSAKFQMAF